MDTSLDQRAALASGSAELSHDAQQALDRLLRVHDAGGLKAALLAMLLAPDNHHRLEAWSDETSAVRQAERIRTDMARIGPAALLPWFERVLARLALAPLSDRKTLLLAVRRLLTRPGPGRALDRLLWLAVRRGFGELPWLPPRSLADAASDPPISGLPAGCLPDLARFTAHLSRSVPSEQPESLAGRDWYLAVMFRWQTAGDVPRWRAPDVDTMVHALGTLERLSWVERPRLARCWVDEALAHSSSKWLAPGAADTLRLACGLLDTALPSDLERHFVVLRKDAAA